MFALPVVTSVSGSSLSDAITADNLGNIVLPIAVSGMTVENVLAELYNYTLQLGKGRSADVCRYEVTVL